MSSFFLRDFIGGFFRPDSAAQHVLLPFPGLPSTAGFFVDVIHLNGLQVKSTNSLSCCGTRGTFQSEMNLGPNFVIGVLVVHSPGLTPIFGSMYWQGIT